MFYKRLICERKLSKSRSKFQRMQWHPTPVLLPGKSHGRRTLVGVVHGIAKTWTRLSDLAFTSHFHALEKEMATHSSVLAWRIPGMGEPGGLPSMGLHSRTRLKRVSSNSSSRSKFYKTQYKIMNQSEKDRCHMISYIFIIKSKKRWNRTHTYRKEIDGFQQWVCMGRWNEWKWMKCTNFQL